MLSAPNRLWMIGKGEGAAVSFMMFQQQCRPCGHTWNAAFGIVGMTQIAAPPTNCPKCGSANIEKLADSWKMNDGSIFPPQRPKPTP